MKTFIIKRWGKIVEERQARTAQEALVKSPFLPRGMTPLYGIDSAEASSSGEHLAAEIKKTERNENGQN